MKTIGVIGVGLMGMGVAKRLLERGFHVRVRDIRPEAEEEARAAGAEVCASPAELACGCDAVITLVVDAAQSEDVVFGADGAAAAMTGESVLLMCSTVAPAFSEALGRRFAERGIAMLDAPVSGGPVRARAGSMSMMMGGPAALVARCGSLLEAMSDKRFHVGEAIGDGSKAKIVNNLLAGVNLAAGCEALALAERLGLDAKQALDVIAQSSGASWIVEDRMRRAMEGDFAPRAAVTLLAKDLGLALDSGTAALTALPLASVARQVFLGTISLGHGEEDDAAVLKFYRAVSGVA